MSRLYLPRSLYDLSACDFTYDFLDIVGDRGQRRMIHKGIVRFLALAFVGVLSQYRMIIIYLQCFFFVCLFVFRFNVPVNNCSVMAGRSQRFLGLTSTVGS